MVLLEHVAVFGGVGHPRRVTADDVELRTGVGSSLGVPLDLGRTSVPTESEREREGERERERDGGCVCEVVCVCVCVSE